MIKEELRGRITPRSSEQPGLPSVALSNAVLQSLVALGRIETRGETVRLIGRQVQLGREELRAKEQISRAFEAAELAVPNARDILTKLQIDRPRAEKILQILLKEKALLKVTEDLIFHRSALEKLRALLARHKEKEARISVSTFKEMTGLSRKYAIPLLEYLDRERVTRREGEDRIIL
jgi:selenocysteine-specific elongation factor